MATNSEITIRIKASDLTGPEFAKARTSVTGFSGDVKKSSTDTQGLGEALKDIEKRMVQAFSVGAVLSFGKELLADADALVKLSDKTGIAIEPMQRLKYAAEQSGNTFEQVTSAVSMMQMRLAGGDDSATGALARLGLSFAGIKGLAPDVQFTTIAAEVAKIQDPMERVKVATDLFGESGAAVLPTMIADIKRLGDEAPVMSDKATRALDTLGDSISRDWGKVKMLGGEMVAGFMMLSDAIQGPAMAAMDALKGKTQQVTVSTQEFRWEQEKATFAERDIDAAIVSLNENLKKQEDATRKATEEAKKFKLAIDEASGQKTIDDAKDVRRVYEELVSLGLAPTAEFAVKVAAANVILAGTMRELPLVPVARGMQEILDQMTPLANEVIPDFAREWELIPLIPASRGMQAILDQMTPLADEVAPKATLRIADLALGFSLLAQVAVDTGNQTMAAMLNIASSTATAWGAATTSGEKWQVGLTAGGQVLQTLGGHVASVGGAMLSGAAAGAALGSVVPGIGTAIGAVGGAVYGLVSGLVGLQAEGKKVNDLRDAFISANGGLATLNATAFAAGMTLDQLLKAGDVAAYEAAIRALDAGIGKYNQSLAQTKAWEDELKFLQDALATTPDWQAMGEKAKLYGIDLASLGPSFQSARLHDAALEIWNDFEMLRRGGADVDGVLLGMSDEISALVVDSIKFGTEIPEQFRPLIQNLIDAGTLIGANGLAITDMSEIQFGAPLVSEVDKIIAKIDELISKLTENLIPEINSIPNEIPVNVKWSEEGRPPPFDPGDTNPGGGDNGYAAGGVVSRPQRAWIAEGGQPEIIGPVDFMARALAGAMRRVSRGDRGSAGPGSGAVIENHIHLDGREVTRALLRYMPDVLAAQGVR